MYALITHFPSPFLSLPPSLQQFVTLIFGFTLLLFFTITQSELKATSAVKALSILVWFLAALNLLSYLLGSAVAIPLVICVFVTGAALSVAVSVRGVLALGEENKKKRSAELLKVWKVVDEETAYPSSGEHDLGGRAKPAREGDMEERRGLGVEEGGGGQLEPAGRDEPDFGTGHSLEGAGNLSGGVVGFSGPDDDDSKPRVSFGPVTRYSPERKDPREQWEEEGGLSEVKALPPEAETPPERRDERRREAQPSPRRESTAADARNSQRNCVFLILSIIFLMMVFWMYPFLLFLLIPFAIWAVLNRVCSHWLKDNHRLQHYLQRLQNWAHLRQSLLFPTPLPTLLRVYLFLDQKVLQAAMSSVSSLMSAFLITSLLVSGLALTVFLALQIRVELTHYITMTTAIWNRTLSSSPQLLE